MYHSEWKQRDRLVLIIQIGPGRVEDCRHCERDKEQQHQVVAKLCVDSGGLKIASEKLDKEDKLIRRES